MTDLLYKQIENIIDKEAPLISNLANVASLLFKMENLNWAGFYLANEDVLYLGPFQGDPACILIKKGKGVCGTSFLKKESIIVDDVNCFAGHIACSSLSKSEIVVPIIKGDKVVAVIDIDSPIYSRFKQSDKVFLENVASLLAKLDW